VGALLGKAISLVIGEYDNVLTLAGLLAGTLLAARFSKPQLPVPQILAAGTNPPSDAQGTTRP